MHGCISIASASRDAHLADDVSLNKTHCSSTWFLQAHEQHDACGLTRAHVPPSAVCILVIAALTRRTSLRRVRC